MHRAPLRLHLCAIRSVCLFFFVFFFRTGGGCVLLPCITFFVHQEFDPDVVIVSAGYDALEADELATASLQPEDYGRSVEWLKKMLFLFIIYFVCGICPYTDCYHAS